MWKKLVNKLTGGRPMELVHANFFVDRVSGTNVNIYRDPRTNKLWLAESPWAFFRVEASEQNLGRARLPKRRPR